jgi:ketosteroid isomerase-like protein
MSVPQADVREYGYFAHSQWRHANSSQFFARQLLETYLSTIQSPGAAAGLFAADGVIELPTVNAHAQGPEAIERFLTGFLERVPDFRFENLRIWIETPDRVFGEYDAEAHVVSTGKVYRQTYAGLLIAKDGRITLLREALDTLAASRAFDSDDAKVS